MQLSQAAGRDDPSPLFSITPHPHVEFMLTEPTILPGLMDACWR
ncbi:MAG TPA: hypothetical protein VGC15_12345 [Acetobacteraceae bacterium]